MLPSKAVREYTTEINKTSFYILSCSLIIVILNRAITALFLFLISVDLLQSFFGKAGPARQGDGSICENEKT